MNESIDHARKKVHPVTKGIIPEVVWDEEMKDFNKELDEVGNVKDYDSLKKFGCKKFEEKIKNDLKDAFKSNEQQVEKLELK